MERKAHLKDIWQVGSLVRCDREGGVSNFPVLDWISWAQGTVIFLDLEAEGTSLGARQLSLCGVRYTLPVKWLRDNPGRDVCEAVENAGVASGERFTYRWDNTEVTLSKSSPRIER